jgi:hypothetical protein
VSALLFYSLRFYIKAAVGGFAEWLSGTFKAPLVLFRGRAAQSKSPVINKAAPCLILCTGANEMDARNMTPQICVTVLLILPLFCAGDSMLSGALFH